MLCKETCPRGHKTCQPLSNLVTEDGKDFVCVGKNDGSDRSVEQDIYRHCFVSSGGTDSMYDYDEYDMLSVVSCMSEALLLAKM